MKLKTLRTIVPGFGMAMLLMSAYLVALLSPYHLVLYHSILPMCSVVWGTLIDLVVVSVLAALCITYLQGSQTDLRTLVWVPVAAGVAQRIAVTLVDLGWDIPDLAPSIAFVLTLIVGLMLWWLRPPAYRAAVRGLLGLLFLLGCSALWMVPELLHQGLEAQRADSSGPVTNVVPAPGRGKVTDRDQRIVWLLFDELSYDQTFDHRSTALAMPSLDDFRSKSVVFSDLKPVGINTDKVIPAFFLGRPVDKIRSDLDGEPMFQFAGSQQWRAFDANATLFADAHRLGWTTGVVGWFNPYCRILARTLDYCFWKMGDGELGGPISTKSSLENAIAPIQNTVARLERKPDFKQQVHEADLAAIMPAAKSLIRDQSIHFVFIHLPVPHPPGMYDRKAGTLRASGSYIDNLALSDRVLAELMSSLNATPLASKTTVIVCSDHSWRISIWRSTSNWTKEDETASQGRFDPRPVLMIHFPGQQAEQDVTAPFEAIRIHEMIERMLRGQKSDFDKAPLAGGASISVAAKP